MLLDLRYDKKADSWSGLFRRDAFSASVILMRPRADAESTPNPLAGAWQSPDLAQPDCLHIAEYSDGSLTGWYDTLRVPGLLRYGNGIRVPDHVMESYGDALRATEIKERHATDRAAHRRGRLLHGNLGRPFTKGKQPRRPGSTREA